MGKYRFIIGLSIVALLIGLFWWLLNGAQVDVLSPKGIIAEQQKTLFIFTILLSAMVVVPVFVMLGLFAYKYRDSNPNHTGYDPEWKENPTLETIWWGIPIAIIGVLAVVTWQTSHSLDPYKKIAAEHPNIPVQVVALQWKWLFIYPEEKIATVNYVVMPKDVPVTFYLTADAPMSAFWIPALGSQIYNMNGMTSELNLLATENGQYRGYTTNINGRGYADMTFTANVVSHNDFHAWYDGVTTSELAYLDNATMNTLRDPSVLKEYRTYRLGSNAVYNNLLQEYMPGMSHGQKDTMPDTSHDDTMETMHNHEGHY